MQENQQDFTENIYQLLLHSLRDGGFSFQRFSDFLIAPTIRAIILRHDVDRLPENSLKFARIQHELGIYGSYYFRVIPGNFQPDIIERIAALGHEIGYHYENMDICKGNLERAYEDFCSNLEKIRSIVPVQTICMHGSPLSKWDSRLLWKKYNYYDLGLIGEPYFDINFNEVAYYTDTGRRWNGDKSIIRDKPIITGEGDNNKNKNTAGDGRNFPDLHTTFDIIDAAKNGNLPDKNIFTFHPQRWHNKWAPWARELVLQNAKNVLKLGLNAWRRKNAAYI